MDGKLIEVYTEQQHAEQELDKKEISRHGAPTTSQPATCASIIDHKPEPAKHSHSTMSLKLFVIGNRSRYLFCASLYVFSSVCVDGALAAACRNHILHATACFDSNLAAESIFWSLKLGPL